MSVRWPFRRRVLRVAIVERGRPVQRMTIVARGARTRLRAGEATVIVREGRAVPPPERAWLRRARPVSWRTMDKAFALSLGVCFVLGLGSAVALERVPPPVPAIPAAPPIAIVDRFVVPPQSPTDLELSRARGEIRRCMPSASARGNGYTAAFSFHLFLPAPGEAHVHSSSTLSGAEAGTGTGVDDHRLWSCVVRSVKRFARRLPYTGPRYAELDVLFQPTSEPADDDGLQLTWHPGPVVSRPRAGGVLPAARRVSPLARARAALRRCFVPAALAGARDLPVYGLHVFRRDALTVRVRSSASLSSGIVGWLPGNGGVLWHCVRAAGARYVAALPYRGQHYGQLDVTPDAAAMADGRDGLEIDWYPGGRLYGTIGTR